MILQVKKKGAVELTTMAAEVDNGSDVSDLVGDMFETMYANNGIGLAANQVGSLLRVFVMDVNGMRQEFINPIIIKRVGKVSSKEGCLSFPGAQSIMIRSKQVTVKGYDKNWNPIKRKLRGLAGYCAQHEIDHLNGKNIK